MIGENKGTKLGARHYDEGYREDVFWAWYHAGRPRWDKFKKLVPKTDGGRIPPRVTFGSWKERYGWLARADALDAEVAREVEVHAIKRKVQMFNRHADVGEALITKGEHYLNEHEFEDAKEAIAAIRLGVQVEAASRGIPDAVMKTAKLGDAQLLGLIENLLGRIPEETPELEQEAITEIIEAEFTDASESHV